jgi:putative inorganic carbon (hco3(-)) transporter
MIDQHTDVVDIFRPSFLVDRASQRFIMPTLLHAFEWIFLALIAALPLMQLGMHIPTGTLTVADVLFVGVLLVGVIVIASGAMQLKASSLYIWILAYVAVAGVSAALGDSPSTSATRFPIEIYMVLLAIVSFNAITSAKALRRVLIAWMIGTAATVGAGLFAVALFYSRLRPSWRSGVLDGYGSLPPGNYPRVHGLFLNMNMCCDYLIVSFVLLLLCRKLGWIKVRAFAVLMIGICITAGFTVSPGLGGLLLAAGVWFWRQGNRQSAIRGASLAAGIIGAFAFFVVSTISPINSGGSAWRIPVVNRTLQPSSRVLCWGEAYKIWIAHPLLGRGTGLEVPCPPYRDASGETEHLLDAHNVYLNTLATKGALGLVGLLGIVASILWPLGHNVPANRDLLEICVALRIAVISAFLYGGLSGSFEHTRHLWVLVGLLAGSRRLADGEVCVIKDRKKPQYSNKKTKPLAASQHREIFDGRSLP